MALALLTLDALRAVEREAAARLGDAVLMARAGAAAAAAIAARWPDRATRVLIACGPGNNGGDGYACALALASVGYAPTVVALAPSQTADASQMRSRWSANHPVLEALPDPAAFEVVVDAMFGIGMSRPLSERYLAAAQRINVSGAHVVALDCPSGLDSERGAWVGGIEGVRAHTTITFIAAKPGLYTGAATDACGNVIVDSLDLDLSAAGASSAGRLNAPDQFPAVCVPRRRDTHKGTFGNVGVLGGAAGMVGATLLAARAALRLGAGRVYVEAIGAPELRVDPMQPELMFRPLAEIDPIDAIVVGCGLGSDAVAQRALDTALARDTALVVDADALSLLAESDAGLAGRAARASWPLILTPHPLEAARLLRCSAGQVQADRVGAALRLAAQTGAIVVLKGAGSVIAAAGRYWINTTGGPALATAGTGDVLSGMIGALLGQGYAPIEAVLAAIWLHGAAADTFGADLGLVAGDIAALAAQALARLRAGGSV